jgi:geranylgeranyl reductase family protein
VTYTHGTNQPNGSSNVSPDFECDVLIVGAGPAGAAAAYYIAQKGRSVILLDTQRFPREKVCGDFVSPGSIRELKKMGAAYANSFFEKNILNYTVIYLNGKELIAGKFPVISDMPQYGQVIPRPLLDSALVEAARNAGANVLEGLRVTNFQVEGEGVTVTATDKESTRTLRTRLLIGADGNNSTIARILKGAEWPADNRAVVVRGYFENIRGSPNTASLYYADASFPGYSWIFPVDKTQANVGVGTVLGSWPPTEQPQDLLQKLINNDAGMKSRLEGAVLKEVISIAQLNLYDSKLPIVGNRVLLVGEAAGLINPFNGEGIQFALRSGRWAAEVVNAIGGNDFSEQKLSAYKQRVEQELNEGLQVSAIMLQLVRNRNLNPVWLKALEIMGERSKKDPEYASLTGGILSGMIFPDQEVTAKIVLGVLSEASVSMGITTFAQILSNPQTAPQNVITITETGIVAAQFAAQNPMDFLNWGMQAATTMAQMAATMSKQVLKEAEKAKEIPQP